MIPVGAHTIANAELIGLRDYGSNLKLNPPPHWYHCYSCDF